MGHSRNHEYKETLVSLYSSLQNLLSTSHINHQCYHQIGPLLVLTLMTNGSLAAMIVFLLRNMFATTPNPAQITASSNHHGDGCHQGGCGGVARHQQGAVKLSPQSSIRVGHCVNLQSIHQSDVHRLAYLLCSVHLIRSVDLTSTTTAEKAY